MRARNLADKGNRAYQDGEYLIAAAYYQQYIHDTAADSKVPLEIWMDLADCQWYARKFDACLQTYERILNGVYRLKLSEIDKVRLAELYARKEKYDKANEWLKSVKGFEKKAMAYGDKQQLSAMRKDSDNWQVYPLSINSDYRIFAPIMVDSTLLVSSDYPNMDERKSKSGSNLNQLWKVRPVKQEGKMYVLSPKENAGNMENIKIEMPKKKRLSTSYEGADVRVIKRSQYIYSARQKLKSNDQSNVNLVAELYNDKGRALFFTIDKDKDIYFSYNDDSNAKAKLLQGKYEGNHISQVQEANILDWQYNSEALQPAIDSTGTILIFSSYNEGGKGGYDLYASTRRKKGQPWSHPQNITSINTTGNEVFPSITGDGYLYFSSNGLPGLGGLDIYRVKLEDALQNKGNVEHLSYPINSPCDDYGWVQFKDGKSGYFTSDRKNSIDDIYHFDYISKFEISGYLKNKLTNSPVNHGTLFAHDIQTNKVYVAKSDSLGHYTVRIPKSGGNIAIRAGVNPYDATVKNYTMNDYSKCVTVNQKCSRLDLYLYKFEVGTTWPIDTIYYAFDKAIIPQAAHPVLDSLARILNAYSLLHVEIASYADRRGSDAYNLQLSQKRADNIIAYLVQKGLDPERMRGKGYGKIQLENESVRLFLNIEQLYQQHRRSEVKVTGFEQNVMGVKQLDYVDLTKYKNEDVIKRNELPGDFFINSDSVLFSVNIKEFLPRHDNYVNPTQNNIPDSKNNLIEKKPAVPAKKEANAPFITRNDGIYTIQVGCFKSHDGAFRQQTQISQILPNNVFCFIVEDGAVYRVMVGQYKTSKEAAETLKLIRKRYEGSK
jgi:outer membrane protein OmpA-like peptidoglycan-associated protein